VTLRRLWAFLAIALPVLAAAIAGLPTVDLGYHLRAGAETLATGRIPVVDTYTFTAAGEPWLNQQWGAQVVLALVFRVAGWTGLVLLRAALVGMAFGLLFDLCRRRSASVRTAAWLTLLAFGCAAITLGLRPQLFGVALFAAVLWLVLQRQERPRLVWLVVPLTILWANVHGSFFLGAALVAIALVEDLLDRDGRWRSTVVLLAATLFATVVNPFGLGVWTYATGIATNAVITSRISEWQPTTIRSAEGALFYVSAAAVAVAPVLAARRDARVRPTAILWLAPFLLIGAWALRGLAWWPFVAAATVAPWLRASAESHAPEPQAPERAGAATPRLMRRANLGIAIVIALVTVAALPVWRPPEPGLGTPSGVVLTAPPGLTAALRDLARPGDRLLAPQPWASWFEFAVPQATVAVDSRIELIPAAAWDAVDQIDTGAAGWKETLSQWRVTLVVASAAQHDLVDRLVGAGWRDAFHDADGTLLAAKDRG
jgi:hypothetical protein